MFRPKNIKNAQTYFGVKNLLFFPKVTKIPGNYSNATIFHGNSKKYNSHCKFPQKYTKSVIAAKSHLIAPQSLLTAPQTLLTAPQSLLTARQSLLTAPLHPKVTKVQENY